MVPKNKRTGATYPMLPNTPRSMLLKHIPQHAADMEIAQK